MFYLRLRSEKTLGIVGTMGLVDYLYIIVPVFITLLSGWAYVVMNPPHNDFKRARACFWASAFLLIGTVELWGVKTNQTFSVRALVVAIFGLGCRLPYGRASGCG